MTVFLASITAPAIAEALVLLALEDADPARAMLEAPELSGRDLETLRHWYGTLGDVALAPFAPDYADHLRGLLSRWPEGVGRHVLDWAGWSDTMNDPAAGHSYDWPDRAFGDWWLALRTAQTEKLLPYFDEDRDAIERLAALINAREAAGRKAEQAAQSFSAAWDPWDTDKIAYHRPFRTPFDMWFLDHVFIPNSFHLAEAAVRRVENREARRFVLDYATELPESLRDQIAEDLPQLVEGQGIYGIHTWQLDRLNEYRDHPPDKLAPFAQVPDLWSRIMHG